MTPSSSNVRCVWWQLWLITQCKCLINVLQRVRGSLDYVSKMVIYNNFIISNFNYCPVVWMFTSKSSLNKLENIQKRALRFVCNDFVSNYSELLGKCGSQRVKLMTLRCMSIEVYRCVKNMNPQYLNEMFTLKKFTYDLRDNSLLERPAARLTKYGLKSFKSYGATIWNLLPATYKIGVSFDTFKHMIKAWSGPNCKCSVCCLFTTWLSNHIHVIILQVTIACCVKLVLWINMKSCAWLWFLFSTPVGN